MAALHRLNPVRIDYVVEQICALSGRPRVERAPLTGCRILDVGCGGGLLAEPLAKLGASVVAIDPEPASIAAARSHAAEQMIEIDYRATTVEAVVRSGEVFDVVTALEVIEHVPAPEQLVASLAAATRTSGIVVMATLSRTVASYLLGIVAAERLLGWLPPGTHDWRRFLRPSELSRSLRAAGLRPTNVTGIAWNPGYQRFERTREVGVNYMITAIRA